jgi:hypothetical protein
MGDLEGDKRDCQEKELHVFLLLKEGDSDIQY